MLFKSALAGLPLLRLHQRHAFPGYVKAASSDMVPEHLPRNVYAAVHPELDLPCHSKAACWLSHAIFIDSRDRWTPEQSAVIQENLSKQASIWGIEADVQQLCEEFVQFDNMKTAASTEEKPVNAEEAGKELMKLASHPGVDFREVHTIARALHDHIDEIKDEKTWTFVKRASGFAYWDDPRNAATMIREHYCNSEFIAKAVERMKLSDLNTGQIDIQCQLQGLKKKDDRGFDDLVGLGTCLHETCKLGGYTFKADDLRKLPDEVFSVLIPNATVRLAKSAAEATEKLDHNTQRKVAALLLRAGVQPLSPPATENKLLAS